MSSISSCGFWLAAHRSRQTSTSHRTTPSPTASTPPTSRIWAPSPMWPRPSPATTSRQRVSNMRRRAIVLFLGAATLMAAAPGCSRGGLPTIAAVPFVNVDGSSTSGSATDKAIAAAQDRLRTEPTNRKARLAVAGGFLQKARETADPSLYGKADGLLTGLSKQTPNDPDVLVARGTLALARHQFRDALKFGERAVTRAPGMEAALGVVVDASNELGRYDEAVDATQRMVDIKPNLASLSRVSYARELRGDVAGATVAMQQAAVAGAGTAENEAYVATQLGLLLVNAGRFDEAATALDGADRAFPG